MKLLIQCLFALFLLPSCWAGVQEAGPGGEDLVLENDWVRVEFLEKNNYCPSGFQFKKGSLGPVVDRVYFSFLDMVRGGTATDGAFRETITEATLVSCSPGRTGKEKWVEGRWKYDKYATFALKVGVRPDSPAILLNVSVTRDKEAVPQAIPTIGIRGLERMFYESDHAGGFLSETDLTKQATHFLLGFTADRNWVVFRDEEKSEGLIIIPLSSTSNRLPRVKCGGGDSARFYRGFRAYNTTPDEATYILIPFVGDGLEIARREARARGKFMWSFRELPGFRGVSAPYQPTEEDRSRGFFDFRVRPFEMILPDRVPPEGDVGASMEVFACRGEYEPASFCIRALKELIDVTAIPTDLTADDGARIPKENIDIRVVKVWKQANIIDSDRGIADIPVPELLLKDDRVELGGVRRARVRLGGDVVTDIRSGTTKQFWVTIRVPDDVESGTYRGSIALQGAVCSLQRQENNFVKEGELSDRVELEVRVLPFDLAESKKTHGIIYTGMMRPETPHYVPEALFRKELENIAAHGMTSCTVKRHYRPGQVENIVRWCVDAGMRDPIVFTSPFLSSSDWQDWAETYRNIRDKLDYPHKFLYYGHDEPNSPEKIKRARETFRRVKKVAGDVFMTLTFIKPEYAEKLGNLLAIPVLSTFFQKKTDSVSDLVAAGHDEVFYYWQCRAEYPVMNRLLYGFYLWKSGATGAYANKFQRAAGYLDAFDDRSVTINSEAAELRGSFLTYPAADGVIDTIQWEACREGVDDARYMSTLENLVEVAATVEGDSRVEEALKRAERTKDRIVGRLKKNYQISVAEIHPAELQEFRRQIAETCAELQECLRE